MALNKDFRVKDALYVGTSGYFAGPTSINTAGRILSAGVDLITLFQNSNLATLTNGDGIASFTYDGDSAATVAVNSTVVRTSGSQAISGVKTFSDTSIFNSGITVTGNISATGNVDGRDISADGIKLDSTYTTVNGNSANWSNAYTSYNGASANLVNTGSSPSQGTVRLTQQNGSNIDIDTGLQTGDSPTFAGATAGNIRVGITTDNEIDTSTGDLIIDSAGGLTTITDNLSVTGTVTTSGLGTGGNTDSVVVKNADNSLQTRSVDSRVWGTSLLDGSSLTTGKVTKVSDANTLVDSIITETGTTIFVGGSLSAVSLSGNGAGLTGVTATPIFPNTAITSLSTTDKLFVNDGANKFITYSNLLSDIATGVAGTGLETSATGDEIQLKGVGGFTNGYVQKWNSTSGAFENTLISDTGTLVIVGAPLSATKNVTIGCNSATGVSTIYGQTITLPNLTTGTDNSVVVYNGTSLVTDEIDPKVWDIKLVDYGTLSQYYLPVATNSTGTVGNSIIQQNAAGTSLTVTGSATVTGSLSVNGNVIANGLGANTSSDNVIVRSTSNALETRAVDSRVWGSTLLDGSSLTTGYLTKVSDANTLVNSIVSESGSTITVAGGFCATTLSGDGAALTNVTATPIFPTTAITTILSTDKLFVNDGANKFITYQNLLTDIATGAAGTGLDVSPSGDEIQLCNVAAFTNNYIQKWNNGTNFCNSTICDNGTLVTVNNAFCTTGNNTLGAGSGNSTTINGTTINVPNIAAGTDNSVVVYNGSSLVTDEIDPKVWAIKLVDYGTLGQNYIPVATNSTGTVGNSIIQQTGGGTGITVSGDTTVTGNLSVTGNFTYIDTTVSVTSALTINNAGTGPALKVTQSGVQPIAQFIDAENGTIIFANDGNVGIGLPLSATPTEKLTVAGNISATGNIIVSGTVDGRDISSDGIRIDSVFTTVSANSATWSGAYSVTSSSSANWNSTYTTVTANSANWNSVYTLYRNASGGLVNNGSSPSQGTVRLLQLSGGVIDIDTGLQTSDSPTFSGVTISADRRITQYATGGVRYREEGVFTTTVGTSPVSAATFAKSGLESAKYVVVLDTGSLRTAFEVLALVNSAGNNAEGTVYGIVDLQAASQLGSIDISVASTTVDLVITAANPATTATIHGVAYY